MTKGRIIEVKGGNVRLPGRSYKNDQKVAHEKEQVANKNVVKHPEPWENDDEDITKHVVHPHGNAEGTRTPAHQHHHKYHVPPHEVRDAYSLPGDVSQILTFNSRE